MLPIFLGHRHLLNIHEVVMLVDVGYRKITKRLSALLSDRQSLLERHHVNRFDILGSGIFRPKGARGRREVMFARIAASLRVPRNIYATFIS